MTNVQKLIKTLEFYTKDKAKLPRPKTRVRACFDTNGKPSDTVGHIVCNAGLKENLGEDFELDIGGDTWPKFFDADETLATALSIKLPAEIRGKLIDIQIFQDNVAKKWSSGHQKVIKGYLKELIQLFRGMK